MRRTVFEEDHELLRHAFRAFLDQEVGPNPRGGERAGIVPHELFVIAGRGGFLGISLPERHGGARIRGFRFNYVMHEEVQRAGVNASGLGLSLHNDTGIPYLEQLATEEQADRWFPGLVSGEIVTAIAMTEPGTGS